MTDAPFTETHRETLTDMATGAMPSWAALYATLHAALAEIDRLTAPCRWTRDQSFIDERDKWDTACDRAFTFIDGGPRENNYAHCPGCGRPLEISVNNT
jgi:hypothetical protein